MARKHKEATATTAEADQTLQEAMEEQTSRQPGDEPEERRPNGYIQNLRNKRERAENGPRGEQTVKVNNKGDSARLLRQEANPARGYPAEVWVQFNHDAGLEVTAQLKEMGFRFEKNAESDFAKGAYILDLPKGQERGSHRHAENVFYDIVNQLRQKHGELETFTPGAGQERF